MHILQPKETLLTLEMLLILNAIGKELKRKQDYRKEPKTSRKGRKAVLPSPEALSLDEVSIML